MSYVLPRQERTREAARIREHLKAEFLRIEKKYPSVDPYISEDDLRKLVTVDAVGRWIDTSNVEMANKIQLKNQIWRGGLKTFCVVVEIEKEDAIKFFIQRSDRGNPDGLLSVWDNASLTEFLNGGSIEETFGKWSTLKCEEFSRAKWKYLAFEFTVGTQASLNEKRILPFRENVEISRDRSDSKLFKVQFDGRYLLSEEGVHHDCCLIEMMRKELTLRPGEHEQIFTRYLQARQKQPNPHIIDPYAFYTHKEKVNILMPLLQGDVKGLLIKDENASYFQRDDDYLVQMLNLSKALASLHNIKENPLYHVTGVHHDLKPANILIDDEGRFILSDFGISVLVCPTAQEQESHGNNSWYLAPEAMWEDPFPGTAGPKSDVYSLGCIFTELLVYMRGGSESVLSFRDRRKPNKRKYAAPFWADGKLVEAVKSELENIQLDSECTRRACYAGITLRMLIEEAEDRLSSDDVVVELNRILGNTLLGSDFPHDEGLQQSQRLSLSPSTTQRQSNSDPDSEPTAALSPADAIDIRPKGTHAITESISGLAVDCHPEDDLRSALRMDDLSTSRQGQVKFIWTQRPWIRDWASKATSCTLMLYGDNVKDDLTLSYIAAQIVKSVQNTPKPSQVIVLQHFCRENAKHRDDSVLVMMASLLHQLISHQSRHSSRGLPLYVSSSRRQDSVSNLRVTFEEVIRSLPDNLTVACVIDGLHVYCDSSTREARQGEAKEILLGLVTMASTTQPGRCRLKVLLTVARQPLAIRLSKQWKIEAENVHPMGRDVLDRQGLRTSFWTKNRLHWV